MSGENMKITIEYCGVWNFEPRAASLADQIKTQFDLQPELIRSGGGVFEIEIDKELVFSKKAEDRFPEDEEILAMIKSRT